MAFIPPERNRASSLRVQGPAVIPADFGEYAGASAAAFLYNDRSISRPLNIAREYKAILDNYREVAGQDFKYRGSMPAGRGPTDAIVSGIPTSDDDYAGFWQAMEEAVQKNPALAEVLPARSHEDVLQRVYRESQRLEAQRDDYAQRATGWAALGGAAGEIAAVVTDPPIALSMLLGAPAATGVMRGMLVEAGVAAAAETAVQPAIQRFREEAGVRAGFDEAVRNVLTAATAGAGFYGAFRVAGAGFRQLADRAAQAKAPSTMTPEERTAWLELRKAAAVEESNPLGRPDPAAMEQHQALMERALMDLKEGRAVRASVDDQLQLGVETISLAGLKQRMRSLETVGFDLDDIVPNLRRFLDMSNEGLELHIARERVDGVVKALRTATAAERPAMEAVQAAEEAMADVLERMSRNTTDQIALQLRRQQGREGALQMMDRSARTRLREIEQQLKATPRSDRRDQLNAERRRIVDTARKRLDREEERLLREAEELDAQRFAAEVQRKDAGNRLLEVTRAKEEAQRTFNERIGQALSRQELRRLEQERVLEGRYEGARAPGAASRTADAEGRLARLTEAQTGEAAATIEQGQLDTMRALADELGDDVEVELADGTRVSAREAIDDLDEQQTFIDQLKACFANADTT